MLSLSFDESASVKKDAGAYSAIVWKLSEWVVLTAAPDYTPGITVKEVEYRDILLCINTHKKDRITVCGDSNLVIRQITIEFDYKEHQLKMLNDRYMEQLHEWPVHKLIHAKRVCNRSTCHLVIIAMRGPIEKIITEETALIELAENFILPI